MTDSKRSILSLLTQCISRKRNHSNQDQIDKMAYKAVTSSNGNNPNFVEQWVSKVLHYSSQYDSQSWPASCVEGKPRVYPKYGDIAGAWAQKHKDANQFIEIEYEEKIYIDKIDIYETYHAGMVKCIKAKHPNGSWVKVWNTPKVSCITHSRIFSPDFERLSFQSNILRIEVDCTVAGNWCEIDAVKISGTKFNFDLPPSPADITNDLAKLVNNSQFSDVSFNVNGNIFHGHRAIMSVRSEYFRAMFSFDGSSGKSLSATNYNVSAESPPSYESLSKSHEKPVELKDVDDRAFSIILHYIYTNKLPQNCQSQILPKVWRTADRFSLDGLKSLAIFELSSALTIQNVVEVYVDVISALPIIESIKTICENYMQENMAEVVRLPSFTSLPQGLMLELIQKMTEKMKI
ncbi:TD and POZ domain-containing protein 1-like isoform X1 [Mytilus trossulus]|uniref:TD and POZ domain-containing protein 1-like isoform X1 n=2 Tax=Mytilus trossulus TaxID=6551 RepID=UPI003004FB25